MIVVHTISDIQQPLSVAREQRKTIGFVPTMGALHDGHISLVRECKKHCDITVVSIFVNPTQFNNPDDFKHYPRTLENDSEQLRQAGADIVFAPNEKEIYPEPDTRIFDFGLLDKVMEGEFRPGHFNGVAQVVSRLFAIVQPEKAFFGEKDFQQVAVLREMVAQMGNQPEIIAFPIVRENDGLAMSSRNMRLTEKQRANAPHIYATLCEAKNKILNNSVTALKKWITDTINANPELETEYVEIVNEKTLQPIEKWNDCEHVRVCVAVYAHPVRLIDNIQLA